MVRVKRLSYNQYFSFFGIEMRKSEDDETLAATMQIALPAAGITKPRDPDRHNAYKPVLHLQLQMSVRENTTRRWRP